MPSLKRNFKDLGSLTTFGVAAECAAYVLCDNADQLIATLRDRSLPGPIKLIGGGSNLLFTKSFAGTIVKMRTASVPQPSAEGVTVSSSVLLDDLCRVMCAAGWWEFANLSGIPGTVGGAAVQNAGAYGMEMSRLVKSLQVYDAQADCVRTLSVDDMHYAYRHSLLKEPGNQHIYIIGVTFAPSQRLTAPLLDYGRLSESVAADCTPDDVRRAVLEIRHAKLPSPEVTGSAGSFFRNPEVTPELVPAGAPAYPQPDGKVKLSAAWLIDHAGCKAFAQGGAAVWQSQPLVIVNANGKATAADILAIEHQIVDAVYSKFQIQLTPEVEHL
jgi:UDP-N-acetylmuramate dehydrogenase